MTTWAERRIEELEQTRSDMYKGIQRAEAQGKKPSGFIVDLYERATNEIKRLGGIPSDLETK